MMEIIRLFCGFDSREEIGYHVFCSSVIHRSSSPVSFTPLVKESLVASGCPIPDGSNEFTYARFLIPWLCGYRGFALFLDGVDMLAVGDIAELWAQRDSTKAVQVVRHDYRTQHPRKYVGTSMECDNEDYDRKGWASVMLINCAHRDWDAIDPWRIAKMKPLDLKQLRFIPDEDIGELDPAYNWICDEQGANLAAKICHWTAGMPSMPAYAESPQAGQWFAARDRAMTTETSER